MDHQHFEQCHGTILDHRLDLKNRIDWSYSSSPICGVGVVLTLGTTATSTYYHHHQLKWPSLPAAITNCALHLFYMCRFTPECILQNYSALTPLYLRHRNCPSHLGMFAYCSKREKKDTENRGLNTSSLPGPRLKKKY